MEGVSQDGEELGSSSTVVLGRREHGRVFRCLIKVTWNKLKTFSVKLSHRRQAFEFGAYPIRMQGLDC
jgi:hypothetical protein